MGVNICKKNFYPYFKVMSHFVYIMGYFVKEVFFSLWNSPVFLIGCLFFKVGRSPFLHPQYPC